MTEVEIEYCTDCNFLPQALRTSERILKQHHDQIDGLRLKTGHDGVFKIRVDGKMVWDKGIDNFDLQDIEKSIRGQLPEQASTVS